ncbi:macrophage mannose receptor 1-like [Antedon mediterranea]|uniref:macrophage mannose receptor 1-like n=1 Tax=Antedon mediterranea TaxID=105859 RepID=UPI003AF642A4
MTTSTTLVFLFISTAVAKVFSCQQGWLSFQDSCYKFDSTKRSWSDARSNCTELGADLVVVRNKAENDFLYANNHMGNAMWIGLSDLDSEANFTWVSTECSQYNNFHPGEPNDYNNQEDCVVLTFRNSETWNDYPCYRKFAYMCEISHFEDQESPSYGSTCPQDIHLLTKPKERKVTVFWQPPVWTDDSSCLFSTTNSHSPGEVIEIPNGVLGKTINVEYTATDMVGRSNTCSFKITVSIVTEVESYNQCRNGGMIETLEDGLLSCICTDGFTGLTCETKKSSEISCQQGWLFFQDSCYKFEETKRSWLDARASCLDQGADLVVVGNKAENDFLYANNPTTGDLWLGLSDRENETEFTWVSTQCSQYKNFGKGEPNDHRNGEDCVELDYTHSDKWNDIPCSRIYAYVCELSHFKDQEPPSYGSSCPDDIHLLTKPNERRVSVFWQPPVWTDDSFCLSSTSNSHSPGEVIDIPIGVFGKTINVVYTATDMAGRSSKCSFKITVSIFTDLESYNQCHNGGIIKTSDDGLVSCTCPDGFSGRTCATANSTVSSCQEGWVSFQDSCYKFEATKTSWSDARSNCLDLGADLVVVRNKAENDFLYTNNPTRSDLWLGISDVQNETNFKWVSKECSQYKNFGAGEPNNYGHGEDCVELDYTHSDKWNDVPCSMNFAYVCEISNFEDQEPPSYGSTCPEDIHLLTKPNERTVNVFWQPPVWTDDSACFSSTSNSHSPGEVIEIPNGVLGKTINVEYTATDMAERSNTCSFKITVSNVKSYNQCQNGGKMKTSDDGLFSCICSDGFSGLTCGTSNNTSVNTTCNNVREAEAQHSSNKGTIENSNGQVYVTVTVVCLVITVVILIGIIIKLARRDHKPTNEIESSNQMQMEVNKEVIDETPTTFLL